MRFRLVVYQFATAEDTDWQAKRAYYLAAMANSIGFWAMAAHLPVGPDWAPHRISAISQAVATEQVYPQKELANPMSHFY